MKVKETIEALSNVDGELEVWITDKDLIQEWSILDMIRVKKEVLTQQSKDVDKIYLVS